jgi:nicotinamidase-related amidase
MAVTKDKALLVMDMQQGIVERCAGAGEVLEPFRRALTAARPAGILAICVKV